MSSQTLIYTTIAFITVAPWLIFMNTIRQNTATSWRQKFPEYVTATMLTVPVGLALLGFLHIHLATGGRLLDGPTLYGPIPTIAAFACAIATGRNAFYCTRIKDQWDSRVREHTTVQ